MWRAFSVAVLLGGMTLLAYGQVANSGRQIPSQELRVREYREFLKALSELKGIERFETVERLKKAGIDLNEHQQKQLVVTPKKDQEVQREVEDKLKPVPIKKGELSPVLAQPAFKYYKPLAAAQQSQLSEHTRSVGRIEAMHQGSLRTTGTGFILKGGIATNCHVLTSIAVRHGNSWTITPGTRIDFSDDESHDAGREYSIVGVRALPDAEGLDVVILEVAPQSLAAGAPLPKALPVRLQAATASETNPLHIGVVGFPNLASAKQLGFLDLKAKGVTGGKIYSPGAVLTVEKIYGLDVLLHVANTLDGSSGSPIFRLDTLDVIGVHNCCSTGGGGVQPPPGTPLCGQFKETRSFRNLGISVWSAGANPALKSFFEAR